MTIGPILASGIAFVAQIIKIYVIITVYVVVTVNLDPHIFLPFVTKLPFKIWISGYSGFTRRAV